MSKKPYEIKRFPGNQSLPFTLCLTCRRIIRSKRNTGSEIVNSRFQCLIKEYFRIIVVIWSFCSILCNLNVIFINNLRNNVESHYIFQLNIMNVIIKYEEVLKVVSKVQLRSFVSNCRGTNFRILGKKPLSSFIYFKRMTWKPPSPSHTHTHTHTHLPRTML